MRGLGGGCAGRVSGLVQHDVFGLGGGFRDMARAYHRSRGFGQLAATTPPVTPTRSAIATA